ncbi:MAG TPA: proline racemase family protein [Bacteroidales bacterium]|nr:proline racemase family protein [Bacteroidales bacterium]
MEMHDDWSKVTTIDMHTGGEPLRIITGGLPEIRGKTILDKRRYFMEHLDHVRTGLMWEPRGHADMYGAVITEAVNEGSDFGTFFLHNEGYSTMCGHAIIALAGYALESGFLDKDEKDPLIRIDAPPGIIRARAHLEGRRVVKTSFLNVPSFVLIHNEKLFVEGFGEVHFDIAYGGAFYAFCEAEQVGLKLIPAYHDRIIDAGRRIKHAVMKNFSILHPFEKDLGFLYGTIFTAKAEEPSHHSRNVCIFANGELDRSATGSGVSARAALHHAKGELKAGEKITIESILGTTMDVEVKETLSYGPYDAVVPEVRGSAYFTGRNEFWFDPDDPLKKGFIFR